MGTFFFFFLFFRIPARYFVYYIAFDFFYTIYLQAPSPRRKDVKFSMGTKQHDGRLGTKAGQQQVAASMPGAKIPALKKCPCKCSMFFRRS